eukprot:jgi/Psemu1/205580/e_gw1.382.57.1
MENIKPDPESTSSATTTANDNNNDGTATTTTTSTHDGNTKTERRRKRRWGTAAATPETTTSISSTATGTATTTTTTSSGPVDSKAKALALKASIAARLAALRSKTAAAGTSSVAASRGIATGTALPNANANVYANANKRPLPQPSAVASSATTANPPSTKRAKHYELDLTVTGPTFAKSTEALIPKPPKPKANPYLAHRASNSNSSRYVDARLEAAGHDEHHSSRRRRELRFVEPGTFVTIAERKRQRAANAVSAGFASGRKAGQYFRSATMGTGGGATKGSRWQQQQQQQPLRAMPTVVEWWDVELLPSKLRRQVASYEGKALSKATQSQMQQLSASSSTIAPSQQQQQQQQQDPLSIDGAATTAIEEVVAVDKARELRTKCAQQASLSYSKTAGLVQHIVPIRPPGEENGKKAAEPVLYLTKKEQKRARKRRREQKQRELQDLQAAGLIEPPEPRLTLQNFIRVMGDQAYVDPSQMEQKVMEQVQKRQRAHLERNEAKKLTREQRAEKLRNKVLRDANPTANATGAIHVALFYVKNASHPYHRTKIDLNAQQLNITGGVVECDIPSLACVVCEGGPKAIQKYTRLMMVRMKWTGPDDGDDDDEGDTSEEEEDAHRFDKENTCALVWTGMATKRQFSGFVFQHCETSAQARKVLRSKGVGQYWDQILAHASGSGDAMRLKLVDSDDEEDDDDDDENRSGPEDNNHRADGMDVEPVEP